MQPGIFRRYNLNLQFIIIKQLLLYEATSYAGTSIGAGIGSGVGAGDIQELFFGGGGV
jgi:hypothetical protein